MSGGCMRLAYHGNQRRYARRFFEGWYCKHRVGDEVLAAIPGVSVDARGRSHAFVQVIGSAGSHVFTYPREAFAADERRFRVSVGGNRFGAEGMMLDIDREGHRIFADIRYGPMTPLDASAYAPDIMGPFSYLPGLECYHGVLSLYHGLSGYAVVDGRERHFDGGAGYIEKDWGRSFPRSWTWMECHDFRGHPGDVLMVAVARVPVAGLHFTGVLCVARIGGAQHRLATYTGARLVAQGDGEGAHEMRIRQGRDELWVRVEPTGGSVLRAPVLGDMSRTIVEHPSCAMRAAWTRDGAAWWAGEGRCAGFERVGAG